MTVTDWAYSKGGHGFSRTISPIVSITYLPSHSLPPPSTLTLEVKKAGGDPSPNRTAGEKPMPKGRPAGPGNQRGYPARYRAPELEVNERASSANGPVAEEAYNGAGRRKCSGLRTHCEFRSPNERALLFRRPLLNTSRSDRFDYYWSNGFSRRDPSSRNGRGTSTAVGLTQRPTRRNCALPNPIVMPNPPFSRHSFQ